MDPLASAGVDVDSDTADAVSSGLFVEGRAMLEVFQQKRRQPGT